MRLSFIFLALLLLIAAFGSDAKVVSGQSSLPAEAWNKLVQAYATVQAADSHGVSHGDIIQMSAELNTAFTYYESAITLLAENDSMGADAYATLSINLSTEVSSRALTLENAAQDQLLFRQLLAYSTALVAGAVSAYALVELHRIRLFLRKKKIVRTELRCEGS